MDLNYLLARHQRSLLDAFHAPNAVTYHAHIDAANRDASLITTLQQSLGSDAPSLVAESHVGRSA